MSDDKASGVMVGSHPVVQSADSAANSNPPKDAFDRYAIDTEADPFKDEIEAAKAQRKKEAEEMATAAATLTGGSEADKAGAHWPEDPDQPKPASTETPGAAQHWPEDPENPPTSGGDGQENGPEQSS